MKYKLEDLEELGMIEILCTTHTNTNIVRITDKGRKLADVLFDAVTICEDAIEDKNNAKSNADSDS